MDDLLQRFLDGDLTAREAGEFERRLAENPATAAELRAWEAMFTRLGTPIRLASPRFDDRVMAAVRAIDAKAQEAAPRRRPVRLRASSLAVAAGLVCCFIAGYLAAARGGGSGQSRYPAQRIEAVSLLAGDPSGAGLCLARLVYTGSEAARKVTVAGDFNGWQPDGLPLVQQQGIWTIELALPPGIYQYMFVVDGQQWVTDPLARTTRDDGYGGRNAVLDLSL